MYFQLYTLTGGDFPVLKAAHYIQYGNGFAHVVGGFLRHLLPGAVIIWEPNAEKG